MTLGKAFNVVGFIVAIVVAGIVGKVFKTSTPGGSNAKIDRLLMKASNTLNKNLPIMVDRETRLDSTIGLNRTFQFNYTLVNISADQITAEKIEKHLRRKIVRKFCSSKKMKPFIKHNVSLSYTYFGKHGTEITTIEVTPSEC